MNVLSLYNKAFLNNNKLANEKLQNLNGAGSNIHTKDKENKEISFKDMMNTEIDKVNDAQLRADDMTHKFMTGETDNLHDVMIATEEARISLELAVQVRNKVIEAFKEVNNMQL